MEHPLLVNYTIIIGKSRERKWFEILLNSIMLLPQDSLVFEHLNILKFIFKFQYIYLLPESSHLTRYSLKSVQI